GLPHVLLQRPLDSRETNLAPRNRVVPEPAHLGHIACGRGLPGEARAIDHGQDGNAGRAIAVDGKTVESGDHGARAQLFTQLANESASGQLTRFDETARQIPGALVRRCGAAAEEETATALDDRDCRRRRILVEDPTTAPTPSAAATVLQHGPQHA